MNNLNRQDSTPLITAVIPVKNRAEYLHHTLRTCMTQNYERFEVIVADDASTDNTREVVEDAMRIDSRIRYMAQGIGVGMRDNFELVLKQVKPGFVIALGGDDGLLPNGISGMSAILNETGTDLLAWPAPVYSYPSVTGSNGQLCLYRCSGTKIVDSKVFLERQARNLHYTTDIESPTFYVKGVASTRLIDKVRNRSAENRFYLCPTPDGYSGIVLAGEVSKYAFSAKPFALHGLSPSSQGLAYLSNTENAKITSKAFFNNVSSKPMHTMLASQPYSPLITLMTVDYLLTARDLEGWQGSFSDIDFKQVLVNSIRELAHGLYGDDRVCRELSILANIAKKHDLIGFFRDKVKKSKRSKKRLPFQGNGLNTSCLFFDGETYNIQNIFDASYAAQNIYQIYNNLTIKSLATIISRSLRYKISSLGAGNSFPSESDWL